MRGNSPAKTMIVVNMIVNEVMTDEPGSICFLTKGEIAWKSDLEALRLINRGEKAPCTLEAIVAKYIINTVHEEN